jgi:hydroxymethylpyrimidine/phosphomethylpyrimidine kinase
LVKNKYILSIAGLDPSSGAGITSDIKTFEAHGLYGLSVCTAITIQNDINFKQCVWTEPAVIQSQIETLLNRFDISVVKIGIIESYKITLDILLQLRNLNTNVKIVLDPILKASAGYHFHAKESQLLLDEIWQYCDIITPNYDEIKALYPQKSIEETIVHISSLTNIYLKGGHRKNKKGWDELHYNTIIQINIKPIAESIFEKHGSGCVLSSALACNIALEQTLEDAARNAKYYTEQFLNSNETLLGNHRYQIN